MKDGKIIIQGKEYEVIAYLPLESGNYVVYTDNKLDANDRVYLYINKFADENNEVILDELSSEELESVMLALKERLDNNGI